VKPKTTRTWHRNAALLVPLLLVNTAAVFGQSLWAHGNLRYGGWTFAILFATAIESVGIYLAFEAHAALMAGHSSGALRMGSYAVGALSGVLNYLHFAGPDHAPTPLAVTFAALSSISPWLWAIRSRSMNRARLFAAGLIDPRAVKFSRLRWVLFPVRTFTAFRGAVWSGEQSPIKAVDMADALRSLRQIDRATARRDKDATRRDKEAAAQCEAEEATRRHATASAPVAIEPPLTRPALATAPTRLRPPSVATRSSGVTRDEVLSRHAADPSRPASSIATELEISKRTVERHLASMRQTNGHRVAAAASDEQESSS
jgi:hypothetical protein